MVQALHGPLMRARLEGSFLNVWSIAGLKYDEVRHVAVLASLLDPRKCPQTGPEFLRAFLERARLSGPGPLPTDNEVRAGYRIRTEEYPLENTDSRVDLSVEGREFLLLIEVKINAREGLAQLQRYDSVLQEKAKRISKRPSLIYLSPRPPQNPPPGTVHVRWIDVAAAARQVGRKRKAGDFALVSLLLLHLAAHTSAFT